MRHIAADGHQVAHHLKTTTTLGKLSDAQFEADFLAAEQALAPFQPVKLFRPPGGAITTRRAKHVNSRGYVIVVGTIFPLDHWIKNHRILSLLVRMLALDGGIIILHDTAARGPGTAALLDELIPKLKQRGYHFALLPEGIAA